MKKIILAFIIPFSLHAQSDSLKVTFSEEKVEQFEKTTLIDEYEKAFGGNRLVKSGLRVSVADPGVLNFQGLSLQYEQKIGKDFSIIGSFGNIFQFLGQSAFETSLEARWYFKMKNKIINGLQKPNITGTYLSFKVQYYPNSLSIYNSNLNTIVSTGGAFTSIRPQNFEEQGFVSLNLGKQFGNVLRMNFILGLKRGYNFEPFSGFNSSITYKNGESVNRLFFTTQNQIGFGLLFPMTKVNTSNACEFLLCKVAIKNLLKFNLNNAFYIDNNSQNLNLDLAYERRIANSSFTINSNVVAGVRNLKFETILYYDESTVLNSNGSTVKFLKPVFSDKKSNQPTYSVSVKEQLRYYFPKKDSFKKSLKNYNFNGVYTGLEYQYSFNKVVSNKINNFSGPSRYDLKSYSVIVGYQTLTNKRSYFDIGLAGGIEGIRSYPTNTFSKDWFGQGHFALSVKLGLAK